MPLSQGFSTFSCLWAETYRRQSFISLSAFSPFAFSSALTKQALKCSRSVPRPMRCVSASHGASFSIQMTWRLRAALRIKLSTLRNSEVFLLSLSFLPLPLLLSRRQTNTNSSSITRGNVIMLNKTTQLIYFALCIERSEKTLSTKADDCEEVAGVRPASWRMIYAATLGLTEHRHLCFAFSEPLDFTTALCLGHSSPASFEIERT